MYRNIVTDNLKTLVEKAQNGETEAFKGIYDLLSDRLFLYAASHTNERDDALDITQDTFIDIWKGLKRFEYSSDEELWGFAFIIMKRKLAKHYRFRKVTVSIEEGHIEDNYEMDVEDYRSLQKYIKKLSSTYQEVLKLRYWSQFSFSEIALVLDTKESTAKVWHHRALKELQEYLSSHQHDI